MSDLSTLRPTLPRLGTAAEWHQWPLFGDWVRAGERDVEIQDFCEPYFLGQDPAARIADWTQALRGHKGRISIHGPYLGITMGNPDREMNAVFTKRCLEFLEIAARLEADQMVIHSPFRRWTYTNRLNRPGSHEWLVEHCRIGLAPVMERAAALGVQVVVENIEDPDPRDRVELVRSIGHPNLAVSLDTGHAQLAGGQFGAPPVVDFIAAAGASLAHVHLQDADGWADRHWHPGEGTLPWTPIFAALARHAPGARLILEVADRHELLPASVARLEAMGLAC